MAYSVFISHSTADAAFIEALATALRGFKVECYVAARDWTFGSSLIEKVEDAIAGAESFLAIVTADGTQAAYVNQEIGIAVAKRKTVTALIEQGMPRTGLREDIKWTPFLLADPAAMLPALALERGNHTAGSIALAGLGFWMGGAK